MNEHFIIVYMEISLLIIVSVGILIIILATVYDVMRMAKQREYQLVVNKLRKPRQPFVHILVYANNNEVTIVNCLRHITRSRYRNYKVTVVDNGSVDQTRQIVKQYIERHPRQPIKLYRKHKTVDQVSALTSFYKSNTIDDFVFSLSADSIIQPLLIKEAVARFVSNNRIVALRVNELSPQYQSMLLLMKRFSSLSRRMIIKSAVVVNRAKIERGSLNVFYTRKTFTSKKQPRKIAYAYDSRLIIITNSARPLYRSANQRNQKHHTNQSVTVLLFIILSSVYMIAIMTYFFYIAATLQTSSLLILGWSALIIWLCIIVWSDEATTVKTKIGLSFCIPSYYFLLYVQLFMMSITAIRSLFNKVRLLVTAS